eukprot:NODE_6187_length_562_cov_10.800000_g6022_i0.p1 GENE.NODE_6187_length_562_cov_10.800000_g6022_i0~~NODE_6187_length_562_cov_10.800000_g6022_i0.p1  ORF type:complete len:124 (+),score=13.69 NODE_6187_length_562_cov_10.800000_g6022_i0:54-425(+)
MHFKWKLAGGFFFAPRRLKTPLLEALQQHVLPKQTKLCLPQPPNQQRQEVQPGKPAEAQPRPTCTRPTLSHLKSLFSRGPANKALELFHHQAHLCSAQLPFRRPPSRPVLNLVNEPNVFITSR